MIGKTINNYVIVRKLGVGGMGEVYYARHNRVEREVAIKVLHSHFFANEKIRIRFKNEANALIKLYHPNIVKIYDYVEQDKIACLIMEYIQGYTLDEYIEKVTGPLPSEKAKNIICSVLEAVQYAHDNNIFHRDIKPGNIMVSNNGNTVRIMDFGIAKLTDSVALNTTDASAQLGTPFYMSPEQVKGLPLTRQSDIYSLGVTLFEMVTGRCPYQGITNLFELQTKIVSEPLPPTSKYYPNVNTKIQNAIGIATRKIPEQRFQSCNDFKKYLQEEEKIAIPIQSETPVIVRDKQIPIQPPNQGALVERKNRSNLWIYLLSVIAIAVVAIVIYPYLSKNSPIEKPTKSENNQKTQEPKAKPPAKDNPSEGNGDPKENQKSEPNVYNNAHNLNSSNTEGKTSDEKANAEQAKPKQAETPNFHRYQDEVWNDFKSIFPTNKKYRNYIKIENKNNQLSKISIAQDHPNKPGDKIITFKVSFKMKALDSTYNNAEPMEAEFKYKFNEKTKKYEMQIPKIGK